MDELERFKRDLNLAEVAQAHGYALDRRESSRSSLVMRHPDGDKIIVATDEDGHGIFFSVRDSTSGSVIDFIMTRRGVNLGHARRFLRDWLPGSFSFPTAPRSVPLPKPQPIPRDRAEVVRRWHGMPPYRGDYLQARGFTADTVAAFADRIRKDERGNLAFRHDDFEGVTGWEVKNRGFTGFASGGIKALFAGRVELPPKTAPNRVVIAESAIDAMSFCQANPSPGLYLSFGGSLSPEQHELLGQVLTRYPSAEVYAATDNDAQGEDFAAMIFSIRPDARRPLPPKGKDWNDAIRPDSQPSNKKPQDIPLIP